MRSLLPGIIALALLVPYGIAEGLWTNRWQLSDAVAHAVARLDGVPRVLGAWEGHDQTLDPRQVAVAEISGYVSRRYVQRTTGAEVSILLVCGRTGPTALHSPDICYAGAGYTPVSAPTRHAEGPASFWVGEFRKPGPTPEPLRIYWAWTGAGAWQAATNPRLQLAHHPALYKLYVIQSVPRADAPAADDPGRDFLRSFLPALAQALFSDR